VRALVRRQARARARGEEGDFAILEGYEAGFAEAARRTRPSPPFPQPQPTPEPDAERARADALARGEIAAFPTDAATRSAAKARSPDPGSKPL
jgi:hypothetical protein